jgi:hypothetical protein
MKPMTLVAGTAAAALLIIVGPGTRPVQAGKRISPVAPACPAEASSRELDADGMKDRCVSRAQATCPPGQKLSVDALGQSDRCVAEGGAGKAGDGAKPACRAGLDLKVKSGEDSCERTEKPVCPPGFKLKATPKEDHCMP